MSDLKCIKSKIAPTKIYYHPDWEPVIHKVVSDYQSKVQNIDKAFTPAIENVFKIFTLGFKNKKVLLIEKEPYDDSDGIPFRCGSLSINQKISDSRLHNFVKKLCSVKRKPFPKNFDILKVPEVFVWNLSLMKNDTVPGYFLDFWKHSSITCLNYIANYIKIFAFFGYITKDEIVEMDLKKTIVLKCPDLVSTKETFLSENNKFFEILDEICNMENISSILWSKGFIY